MYVLHFSHELPFSAHTRRLHHTFLRHCPDPIWIQGLPHVREPQECPIQNTHERVAQPRLREDPGDTTNQRVGWLRDIHTAATCTNAVINRPMASPALQNSWDIEIESRVVTILIFP